MTYQSHLERILLLLDLAMAQGRNKIPRAVKKESKKDFSFFVVLKANKKANTKSICILYS